MGAEAYNSIPDRNLAVVQRKHRGRSSIEGMKVVAVLAFAFAALATLAWFVVPAKILIFAIATGLFLICAAFVFYFFRDANPQPPGEPGIILSPSHGTVDYIDTTTEMHFLNGPAQRISIYLSLLNVHVQHAPVSGRVEFLRHFPGRWSRAIHRDASVRNEHLLVGLSLEDGGTMAVRLISGIWVRRIVPWIAPEQCVLAGERIGLIRFGSRVDVFLPPGAQLSVKPGDCVRGGETVLARLTKS